MKKFFIFFIITIIITSCVPNKKISNSEQLKQDKIRAEKILGRWKMYLRGGTPIETNFYKNNTCLWQRTIFDYKTETRTSELLKMKLNWKITDSKIILLPIKIESNISGSLLGKYGFFSILEFLDDKITLKSPAGNEVIMIRR